MNSLTTLAHNRTAGLLSGQQWLAIIGSSLLVVFLTFPAYFEISPWIGLGIFTGVATIIHYALVSEYILPIPHVAILFAVLGYVIGPWINVYFPPPPSESAPPHWAGRLYGVPNDYFSYAGPVVFAVAIGWLSTISFMPRLCAQYSRKLRYGDPRLFSALDYLLFGGMACTLCLSYGQELIPGSLTFLFILFSNLRFLGAMGWMLSGHRGWIWRTCLVLGVEILASTSSAFFLDLILWGTSFAAILFYRYRVPKWALVIGVLMAALLIPGLQHAKWKLRDIQPNESVEVFGENIPATRGNRPLIWIGALYEGVVPGLTLSYSDEFIGENILRYNQGWIIDRVMRRMPSQREHAGGETVWKAAIAAIFPRFMLPDKANAGGRENFTTYTGLQLNARTSMNLGYAGEMYANFGFYGGIFGCFAYAAAFGLLFRWMSLKSHAQLIILAFIPYVLHWSALMEVGLLETFGYTFKAAMVMLAVQYAFPPLRFKSPKRLKEMKPRSRHSETAGRKILAKS